MMKKELARNSISGVLQVVLTSILVFVSVPIFISKLGMDQFGVFSVVAVIGNLSIFTNLGLNGALLVFLGKQGKCRQSDHDVIVTQVIMGTIVFSLTLVVYFCSSWLLKDVLGVSVEFADAKPLLLYLLIANAILLMGQSYTAVLDSMFAVHITNTMQFVYSLIYWGGQIVVVSLGGGLAEVGIVAVFAAFIWFIGIFVLSCKRWGRFDFSGLKRNFKQTARKQISYGARIYGTGLISFLFVPLTKVFVSRFLGLDIVAIFEIGLKIKDAVNSIIGKALYPLQPYINREPIGKLLHDRLLIITSVVHLLVVILSLLVVFTFPELMKMWLQEKYTDTVGIFTMVITIGYLFSSPTVLVTWMYLIAKGHPEKTMLFPLFALIVNAIAFFTLLPLLSIYSLLVSYSLGMLSSYVVGIYLGKKYIDSLRSLSWEFYFKLLALVLFIAAPCCVVYYNVAHSLWNIAIFSVLVVGLGGVGAYLLRLIWVDQVRATIELFKK